MAKPPEQPQLEHQIALWALKQWADFPVGKTPRPIVLLGGARKTEGGFDNAEAKTAFRFGQFVSDPGLPDEPLQILRSSSKMSSCPNRLTPLRITDARRAQILFATDRGDQTLPGWRIKAQDVMGTIWVLDETTLLRCWTRGEDLTGLRPSGSNTHHSATALIESNNTTLRFRFTGASPHTHSYPSPEHLASHTAVVVIPRATPLPGYDFTGFSTLAGHEREIVIELDRPLGNRVLVDWDASPIPVVSCQLP